MGFVSGAGVSQNNAKGSLLVKVMCMHLTTYKPDVEKSEGLI